MFSKAVIALSLILGADAFLGSPANLRTATRSAARTSMSAATKEKDIVDVLSQDHHECLEMLKQMQKSDNPEEMRILNDKCIIKLVQHSIIEETLVYPLMANKLENGSTEIDKDKKEHHHLEELMRDLEKANPTQPNWNPTVQRLAEALDQHRLKEEKEQFPALRKAISREELVDIVGKAQGLRALSPTHPHPVTHLSHTPQFDTTVGSAVGLVDRLRDAVTGRTTDELDEVSRGGPPSATKRN